MKFIKCDLCFAVFAITHEEIYCNCGNIGGKYQDNHVYADIFLRDVDSFTNSRVFGVSNAVVMGYTQKDEAHVGKWNDYQLRIFLAGEEVKYDEVKKPIIPFEEYLELMTKIFEIGGYTKDDVEFSKETGNSVVYKMKDEGIIYLWPEREDVKEPMICLARIENGFLTETKICAYKMR